ncbi:ornithine carbamoyltransferase [Aquabacterium sp.]|uniref:ornithine carbamoyltransferase n=1 Tax=Aquabacterium sp. TaxID=1872578 RepID=UPI002B5765E1|nr:ornithine carbamoyltransferase [Aquabacterium sp.]HSW05913.1 ornithine carbamoyltransferase [Aquabacterium sp.]
MYRTDPSDAARNAGAFSPAQREPVLARAMALKQAAREGLVQAPLRGKYFGLVSESPDSPEALLFVRAATELGAQVAQIRPSVARLDPSGDLEQTAQWLGRLYDAVECQGLAPGMVERMRAAANVPVLDGIACASHPIAAWIGQVDAGSDSEGSRFLVQAALMDLVERAG